MNRLPFDLATLGRHWGWKATHAANAPAVIDALLSGEPVAAIQEAGQRTWLGSLAALPKNLKLLTRWPESLAELRSLIVISDRALPPLPEGLRDRTVAYRPPTLALGVSCFRGLPTEALTDAVTRFCELAGLAEESVMALAAPFARKHEPALVEFAEDRVIPFLSYPPDKLALLAAKDAARRRMAGLCEPAAQLGAGGVKELAAPRQVFGRLALAAARRRVA